MEISPELLSWLIGGSVLMFVVSLIGVPAIIVRLPEDYFCHASRRRQKPVGVPMIAYYGWLVLKNLAGAVFVLAGLAMLVLPGQGVLSVIIGISLLNFPGKYRLEKYFISRRPVLNSINWMRRRAGRAPLIMDTTDHGFHHH